MTCLGLGKVPALKLLTCGLAISLLSLGACKSSDGDGDNGGNGGGGDGGGGGETGGKGGGGKGGSGGNTGGTAGSDVDAGVADSGPPTPPPPVIEDYAAPTGTLPVSLSFKTADDLKKNFYITGEGVTQSPDSDGVLKIEKGKAVLLTYDTTPDKDRTSTFESFTATIKFHSASTIRSWVVFATDKNRNDGQSIGFGMENDQPGPVGISDVDNIFYGAKCWAVSLYAKQSQCATETESYGWTAWAPSMMPQVVKITVKADKTAKTIRARGEFFDDTGDLIDGSVFDWANLNRVNGEVSFGINAVLSDAFIDEITIKEAEAIADPGIIRLPGPDANLHVWIPPSVDSTKKLKGLILTAPDLNQPPNGTADFALFGHLRKFATAYGWGLLGGARQGKNAAKDFFKADLAALATKANRPEMNTVPLFFHHLLNNFSYQALSDPELAKKTIGFLADKPKLLGEINTEMQEKVEDSPQTAVSRAVPGFITWSKVSLIAQRSSSLGIWYPNRFFEETMGGGKTDGFALWAYASHGMQTNAVVDSWMLYLGLLQEMIAQRTVANDGTSALKPVDKSKGYIGYSEAMLVTSAQFVPTLEPFAMKGFPVAPPIADQVSKPQPDFIPGPSTGMIWQAFDYCIQTILKDAAGKPTGLGCAPKKVFWTTNPKHGVPGASRLMKLGVDPSLTGWKEIKIFDALGATPTTALATLTPASPLEYEFKNLTLGAHSFIARLVDANDKVHLTHPAMAIFAP